MNKTEKLFFKNLKEKNLELLSPYNGRDKNVKIKCKTCGEIVEVTAKTVIKGTLPCCLKKKKIEELNNLTDKNHLVIGYKSKKVKIKCLSCDLEKEISRSTLNKGYECKCKKREKQGIEFIKKLEEKHPNKYEVIGTFSTITNNIKVKHIECGEEFETTPERLLLGVLPCCRKKPKRTKEQVKKDIEKYINDVEVLNLEDYKNQNSIMELKCLKCNKISKLSLKYILMKKKLSCCECLTHKTTEEYQKALDIKFPNTFKVVNEYTGVKNKIKIKHLDCNSIFESNAGSVLSIGVTPCCSGNGTSKQEKEVLDFIKNVYKGKIETSSRGIITPLEIDIYLPDLNLAFEYNGLYWHSTDQKDKNYHLKKTKECEQKGIQLIHIFEDEWLDKKEICKSRILNLLKKPAKRIYARKCQVKKVSKKDKKEFFEKNHIQGDVGSSIEYGLFQNREMISCISFSKLRNSMSGKEETATHELLRFSNKLNYSVVGGFSKLLKNTLKKEKSIKEIKTFADRRWSTGNVYEKTGFEFSHDSRPNYFYTKGSKRFSRIAFQKHKLKDKLVKFDDKKSETENMKKNGYKQIFDSGNKVYYLKTQ